jgi:glycerol kinase
MKELLAAIDQGTTSTRCMLFDRSGPVASAQAEHQQIFPQPGWVEHDPREIIQRTEEVMHQAIAAAPGGSRVVAVGITNQRETLVCWDRKTGQPLCNAIVWQDVRSASICQELAKAGKREGEQAGGIDRFRPKCGLPLATYFTGPKITWAMRHLDGLSAKLRDGRAILGTIDSWLIWNLNGGAGNGGGNHVTDVTNASRTMLMDLKSLDWDEQLLAAMGVPRQALPRIAPSIDAQAFGRTAASCPLGADIPIAAALGDQQAALLGQACTEPGEMKNTYGTGCFLLRHTGTTPVFSSSGLLTTLALQISGQPPAYALEGSVAVAGSLVQWLRDNLRIISSAAETEALAAGIPDNGGVFIVPAFSGLFAPWWRPDARGVIVGLTRFADRRHLARAALEATALQTLDVVTAMERDCPEDQSAAAQRRLTLRADGGMATNNLLMQIQADLLDCEVVRPVVTETTALGAANAAGLAVGFYPDLATLRRAWRVERQWHPAMDDARRQEMIDRWHDAVKRSLGQAE